MASSEPVADAARVTARYARWDGVGRPFTVVETTTPVPPGPGEVLVRVDLATVCGSDLHTVSGRRESPAPGVLGHEYVGTVVSAGSVDDTALVCADGTPITEGLRVVWSITASCGRCDRCTRGLTQKCRRLRKYGHEPLDPDRPFSGGFASHCVLMPGTTVVPVPPGMPDEVAAPAACATATVAAVMAAAGPAGGPGLSGARVLVTGLGTLGLTAVAMAAASGAEVTAMDPDPGRREWATRFGATTTSADGERLDGMDVAVELSGAPAAVDTCVRSLDVGGTAVLAGSVLPGPAVPIDPERVVRRLLTIVGVHNYRPADLLTAVGFLAAHHGTLPFAELVAGRYPLDAVGAAFAAAGSGPALRQAIVPGA